MKPAVAIEPDTRAVPNLSMTDQLTDAIAVWMQQCSSAAEWENTVSGISVRV